MSSDESAWMVPGEHGVADGGGEGGGEAEAWVAERFEVRRTIGEGGMGTVYEAIDRQKGELVAIKVLKPVLRGDGAMGARFTTEASISIRLTHPNIVSVFDYHVFEGRQALVMELLRGRTLRERLSEAKLDGGEPVSVGEMVSILSAVCDALAYAHELTEHRDVKPENVWLCEDGTVKLMDFGLAKATRPPRGEVPVATLTGLTLGSPYYMAPEQLGRAGRIDHRADQFAVGVIAYEMLTGELPVGLARPLEGRRPDLPYRLTRTIDRALAPVADQRFGSISEFAGELRAGAEERPGLLQRMAGRPWLMRASLGGVVACIGLAALLGGNHLWESKVRDRVARAQKGASELAELRIEEAALRRRVEALRRRDRAARNRLETSLPRSTGRSGAEEGTEGEAILGEAELEMAKHVRRTGDRLWSWLSPRVDEDGADYEVAEMIASAAESLRGDDLEAYLEELGRVRLKLDEKVELVARCESVFASVALLEALRSTHPVPGLEALPSRVAVALSKIDAGRIEEGADELSVIESEARGPSEARFVELRRARDASIARWEGQFDDGVGVPSLEFLGYPEAKAEAAERWRRIGRYDRALPLLEASNAIYEGWSDEWEALYRRHELEWSAIPAGQRLENPIGMRFVEIDGVFWSVWETRVIDFARFIEAEGNGWQRAGEFWKRPGHEQEPTSPVVGIDRITAGRFAGWLRKRSDGWATGHRDHRIPSTGEWLAMLEREPDWERAMPRRAIWPNRDEFDHPRWDLYYRDTVETEPTRILRVGLGVASRNRLHGLFGNVWEWSESVYQPAERELGFTDEAVEVMFGGGAFGEVSWHGFDPPEPTTCFVARRAAVGFRLIVAGNRD